MHLPRWSLAGGLYSLVSSTSPTVGLCQMYISYPCTQTFLALAVLVIGCISEFTAPPLCPACLA